MQSVIVEKETASVDRDTPFTEDSELDSPSVDSLLSVYGSSMPILYCYDDITWDTEFGSGSASRPNLLYSSDFLCAYDSIRWDTPEADDSSTSIVSETKPSLFLLYDARDIDSKWYRLSLTSEGENTSDKEVITSLLQDGLVSCELSDYSTVTVIDSSVYRIIHTQSSASSHLQVLNTDDLSWKGVNSLSKVRIKPWIVSMGKKIFVLGAEAYIEDGSLHEMSDIEVFDLHTRQRLSLISIKISENWYRCFVVASESLNKIIIGSCDSKSLYLYDVCTCQLEQLDLGCFDICCWRPRLTPAVVGNILFWFSDVQVVAYDLLDRCFWEGTIDDIDLAFLSATCNAFVDPMLINLGGGALCLICYKSVWPTTTIHCCVFDVPEFTTKNGRPSLRGCVSSTHKFNINYACCLSNVLVI